MANQPETLVAGRYAVHLAQPRLEAAGGLPAFAATDQGTGDTSLIAIQVTRDAPARQRPMHVLTASIEGLMTPLAHGQTTGPNGVAGYFVICSEPPGPPIEARLRPWTETAVIEHALRPLALVLDRLADHDVTHRAIRLNNVFQVQRGQPLTLGAAWAAPPAMQQPALFEPPYSAMCHPAGRGDGSIADDVYALGVLLLTLALGRPPLAELDDDAVLRRKLEVGSNAALTSDARLPPMITDLVRGMLAEDPEHRPTPALLLDPAVARSRRVAARPPHKAQRSLPIGAVEVWDARTLAYAMARQPDHAITALRGGAVVQWLRRALGDATQATHLDEILRHRQGDSAADEHHADTTMLLRAITAVDPLAPLCWRGVTLWPDGLGPLMVAAQEDSVLSGRLDEMIDAEAVAIWAALRQERCDMVMLRLEARQNRAWLSTRGLAGGRPRLTYMLNPMLPCASPLTAARWVARVADLPLALEAALAANPQAMPLDAHIAAFIAARAESRLDDEANSLLANADNPLGLTELRLLTQLQFRFHPRPLPALANWVAGASAPLVALWHNRPRRRELTERLRSLAQGGMLMPMLAALEDPPGRSADASGAKQAATDLNRIDTELRHIATGASERRGLAARIGQEIAAGIGLAAMATMLAIAALG